ncbi:MAG: hypothetical protein B6U94_03865 [Thermofilum sp. ex4484_79]|nr:MAG: hypothetical protein B6U94_03865 [Thermofilum sp. ex4484_79]
MAYPPPPPPPPAEEGGPVSDESKTWALIGWALGIVGAIIVFATRKEDKYAVFWAKQSLIFSIGIIALDIIIWILAFIFWPFYLLTYLVALGALAVWIIGILKAYGGEWYKFPVIYDIAKSLKI